MFISNAHIGLLLCSGNSESTHTSLYLSETLTNEYTELNQFQVHLFQCQMALTVSMKVYMAKQDHYSCSDITAHFPAKTAAQSNCARLFS